jgi:predicted transcriptional regulator
MTKQTRNIKIGIATEEQINKEFIKTWHKAEKGEIEVPEERLYFVDPKTFFQVLSKRRIALLKVLHTHGVSSIRELSRLLNRDYKNVYQDVQLLKKMGLIHQDENKKIYVPWDKINAEISLAA